MTTTTQQYQLTSTTAPGKVFGSREELANHYKSDWHKYNLKRREAGLPLLLESDFQARLAAALSLRQEKVRDGTSHLKKGKEHKPKKKKQDKQEKKHGKRGSSNNGVVMKSSVTAYENLKQEKEEDNNADDDDNMETTPPQEEPTVDAATEQEEQEEEEENENVVIDPKQCLFDRHFCPTVEDNAHRMYQKYGLFIPDREYLTDLEGLIGYCHEKIKLGHMCLYCHKVFPTWQGCQKHMISKRHTKLRYEAGIDLEDLSVFYDFRDADNEFLRSIGASTNNNDSEMEEDDGNDEDWEDINDGEGAETDDDDDDEYEEQLAQFGFDVTELGELILPNGRIIGHRALARYYKQRIPTRNNNTAVVAARRAAGERLLNGQVYNLHAAANKEQNALALSKAGIRPGIAAGRAGNGILVKGAGGVYTSLSIYRYRAVMRKQRREDKQGKRLYEKTKQNINRMDKKHNRLMNGVSVAHAAR